MAAYNDPARFDDFPSLSEAFRTFAGVSAAEIPLFESVFATHERGQVPVPHQTFLQQIASTHWLGVVSNICARPEPWLAASRDVFDLFQCLVFSSEGRSIKPSSSLFQRAINHVPSPSRMLFVGDSLERDILPAKKLSLATAWIAPNGMSHDAADVVIASLPELATR